MASWRIEQRWRRVHVFRAMHDNAAPLTDSTESTLVCDYLRRTFSLTPREAFVAARIASGQNARQIAEELGISVGTVRVHIKRILGKTGTNRQSQLVGLVLHAVLHERHGQDAT